MLKQYSYNNHSKYGWGNDWFNKPERTHSGFQVTFGKSVGTPGSFRDECVRAARLIGESTKEPIVVALSGGVDSEVIARSFLEAEIPFKAVIVRFTGDVN